MTNINAYYKYAQENRKRNKKELRNTLLWFGLVLLLLLGVWGYLNYFNTTTLDNSQNMGHKSEVSENGSEIFKATVADKVDAKMPTALIDGMKEKVKEKTSTSMSQSSVENNTMAKTSIETVKQNVTALSTTVDNKIVNSKETEVRSLKVIEEVKEGATPSNTSVSVTSSLENKIINEANISVSKVQNLKITEEKLALTTSLEVNSSTPEKVAAVKLPEELFHLYLVGYGETMYDIARKQYGDTNMYLEIVNANPDIENPNDIKEGQEILLPIVDESKSYSQILRFK